MLVCMSRRIQKPSQGMDGLESSTQVGVVRACSDDDAKFQDTTSKKRKKGRGRLRREGTGQKISSRQWGEGEQG